MDFFMDMCCLVKWLNFSFGRSYDPSRLMPGLTVQAFLKNRWNRLTGKIYSPIRSFHLIGHFAIKITSRYSDPGIPVAGSLVFSLSGNKKQ